MRKTIILYPALSFLCLLLNAATALSQSDYPTGDTNLTPANIELLKRRIYRDPQLDGAGPPVRRADISVRDTWRLKIKNQQRQNSCQSFAVGYAADVLERKQHHSSTYIWDLLSYKRISNQADPFREDHRQCALTQEFCSTCSFGFNIVDALAETRGGVPFEAGYKVNNCGAHRPAFNSSYHEKFRFDFIWWDEDRYSNDLNYPANKFTVDDALIKAKEKISNGIPVLISINAAPFQSYVSGVHHDAGEASSEGWHAMAVIGFDDDKEYSSGGPRGAFKIANSWDGTWGEQGYLWISYESFKRLTRLIAFMSVDTSQEKYDWEPINILSDGAAPQDIKPNSRIGIYQIELLEKAKDDVAVCLDANTWYPDRSPFQVILFKCQNEIQKNKYNNQKWEVVFKEQKNGDNYYVLKSLVDLDKNRVLAIRDKNLVIEEQSNDFDENQLWLIRRSPITQKRAIAWAGAGGEFILQGDERKLKEYTREKAAEASVALDTFNNLPRQTWRFIDSSPFK
jgi:hypothetical protein